MLQDLFQMKRQKRRFVVIFRVATPNIFPRPHAVRFKFVGLSSDQPQRRKFPRNAVVGDGGAEMQRNDREVSFQRGSPVVFLFDLLIFSPELFGECPCAFAYV